MQRKPRGERLQKYWIEAATPLRCQSSTYIVDFANVRCSKEASTAHFTHILALCYNNDNHNGSQRESWANVPCRALDSRSRRRRCRETGNVHRICIAGHRMAQDSNQEIAIEDWSTFVAMGRVDVFNEFLGSEVRIITFSLLSIFVSSITLANDYRDAVRWRRRNWEHLQRIWASKGPSITLLRLFYLLYVYVLPA